jgi:peptide-methionine (S)-S-oxide reductase
MASFAMASSFRIVIALSAGLVAFGLAGAALAAEAAVVIPAPALDSAAGTATTETAVIAGGCFWGIQGVYQRVKGVESALSGYSGGEANTAHYQMVGRGSTGHAEAVEIKFNPQEISYGKILQIYFSVAHDPTQLDRQGPDWGTQYRSEIFATSAEQKAIADAYIAQLDAAKVYPAPIVTKVEPLAAFYAAEDYHQDYLINNPTQPYIVYNDLPKLQYLAEVFPELWRDEPVTVASK